MGKLGIKETTEAVVLACRIASGIDNSLKDGKVDMFDGRYIFGILGAVKPALDGIKIVPQELADLDLEERSQLTAVVATELDLENDLAEGLIEESFDLAMSILSFAQKVRYARRPATKGDDDLPW